MITINLGGTVISVVDIKPLREMFESYSLDSSSLALINRFTYKINGSFGRFMVRTVDISTDATTLNTSLLGSAVTLTITGQDDTFVHAGLFVERIEHFQTPLVSWDDGTGDTSTAFHSNITIIHLCDCWKFLDTIIPRDYIESTEAETITLTSIIDDLMTITNIGGSAPTFSGTGLPSISPRNVLSAGVRADDFITEVANRHFLVAYASKSQASPGQIIMTNAERMSGITSLLSARLLHTAYGSEVAPYQLGIRFRPRNCTGTLIEEQLTLTPVNDAVFTKNQRYQITSDAEFFYPFYDLDPVAEDATTQAVIDAIRTNWYARTKRCCTLTFLDVVDLDLGADIQSIEYRYTDQGIQTIISTVPPTMDSLRYIDSFMYKRESLSDQIQFQILTVTNGSGEFAGYDVAVVIIKEIKCCNPIHKINDVIQVVDTARCFLNKPNSELNNKIGFASRRVLEDDGTCFYSVDNLCSSSSSSDLGDVIGYIIDSARFADPEDPDEVCYAGLVIATVTVYESIRSEIILTQVQVVDHRECVFDLEFAELVGMGGWAHWARSVCTDLTPTTSAEGATSDDNLSPPHWCALNLCCP